MFSPRKIFPPFAFLLCLTTGVTWSAGKERSTSTSRQFLVYGAEVRVRGMICDLAERTKSDLLRLLGLRDSWQTPLIVNLDYPRANVPDTPLVQLDVSQLGYGLKLQLNLLLTREMKGVGVQRELLRAILVELMYRDRGSLAAGMPYVTPPDWLVEGMLALQPGRDSDNDAELLRSIVASKRSARSKISSGNGGRSSTRPRGSSTRPMPGRSFNCCSTSRRPVQGRAVYHRPA